MELNVTISVLVLLPVALALVAGGLILYRRSTQAGWRAAGMGSLALGVGVLLVFTLTFPVSTEGEAPEPVIGEVLVPPQSGEITHGDPTYDEWLSDFGDGKVVTSVDDIDPELILEPSSPMKPICADFGCGIGDRKVLTSADDIDPELILADQATTVR